ncbi:hypothetical protein M885DRAFT_612265 [Pelagophyceae sp. CCMP2097]|nr:hypothetical protein M885DRAFT_612265 [Pelagophyceae sp. CCMP2097]|mmetsp:Transcript_20616/g.71195  ORF Transcript_20616/g.71195 Transcript_20616/m.71195 type:complete len:259 (-) Transcript_20616:30-806(-)
MDAWVVATVASLIESEMDVVVLGLGAGGAPLVERLLAVCGRCDVVDRDEGRRAPTASSDKGARLTTHFAEAHAFLAAGREATGQQEQYDAVVVGDLAVACDDVAGFARAALRRCGDVVAVNCLACDEGEARRVFSDAAGGDFEVYTLHDDASSSTPSRRAVVVARRQTDETPLFMSALPSGGVAGHAGLAALASLVDDDDDDDDALRPKRRLIDDGDDDDAQRPSSKRRLMEDDDEAPRSSKRRRATHGEVQIELALL